MMQDEALCADLRSACSPSSLQRQVVALDKTRIFAAGDDHNLSKFPLQHRQTAIIRVVVDDDDFPLRRVRIFIN